MYLNFEMTAEQFRQDFLYQQPKLFKGAAGGTKVGGAAGAKLDSWSNRDGNNYGNTQDGNSYGC